MLFSCEPDRVGLLWGLAVPFLGRLLPCKFADFLHASMSFQVLDAHASVWVFLGSHAAQDVSRELLLNAVGSTQSFRQEKTSLGPPFSYSVLTTCGLCTSLFPALWQMLLLWVAGGIPCRDVYKASGWAL